MLILSKLQPHLLKKTFKDSKKVKRIRNYLLNAIYIFIKTKGADFPWRTVDVSRT